MPSTNLYYHAREALRRARFFAKRGMTYSVFECVAYALEARNLARRAR